jgi:hypothetical protein
LDAGRVGVKAGREVMLLLLEKGGILK